MISSAMWSTATQAINAAEEGGHNPLLPATDELIVGTICFLLLFALLAKFAFPKIHQTLAARTEAIEGGIERAEKAQEEAQRTLEAYREQLEQARHEASTLREQARVEGAAIVAEMRTQAQAEASRITTAARAEIDAERERALRSVRAEVGRLAVELAGRVVGEALTDEQLRARVVDRFLSDLEGTAAGGAAPETVGS